MRLALGIGLAGLAAWLASGFFVVQSNERGVVRRFGRAVRVCPPGPHFDAPWGLAQVDRVRVDTTQQVTVGAVTARWEDDDASTRADQGRYLTGDQNLVDLGATVQYSVSEPERYLYTAVDSTRLIEAAVESLVTELAASLTVDDILIGDQVRLGERLEERLEVLVDRYDLGVKIQGVHLTGVAPPAEVADAFNDVVKARSDKEKRINDATSYADRVHRQAEARCEEVLNGARAYAEKRQGEATSQAQRFRELLAAYQQAAAPDSVLRRIIFEALEESMPRLKKVFVSPGKGEPLDLGILHNGSSSR